MESIEDLCHRLNARFPDANVVPVINPGPAGQHSLLVPPGHMVTVAQFLRDDPALKLDLCSNVTGVDWPDKVIVDTVKSSVPDPAGGPPKVTEQKTERLQPGYLEVVYHLYSVAQRHGPVVIRMRTANRSDQVTLPSLTPVWRSAEFQEREIFDLFGVVFSGHPDLRRILMWDGFLDHPMRKDYVEPPDYDWEPTPHGDLVAKSKPPTASAAASAPSGGKL